jgi:NADH:ubiquinone oxidoreductase subunit E
MKKLLAESEANQRDLIHILHKVQAEEGYISPETIAAISKHLKISENEIYGVLTFYKAFSLKPRGKHLITICLGTACHVRGAPRILDEFKRGLCIEPGETSEDNLFTLETVNCVGACALGPIAIIDGDYHGQLKTRDVDKLIGGVKKNSKE